MTPKEKAIELVNKFRDFADGIDSETDRFSPNIEKKNAKQCALIAVDESINILDEICKSSGYDPFESPLYNLKYWKEVKQEIELL